MQARYALKALLSLGLDPQRWQSTRALAESQNLPEPMLEQLLLRLRRAGVLQSRRGRIGGYRLRRPPGELSLVQLLLALDDCDDPSGQSVLPTDGASSADQVMLSLSLKLQRVRYQSLAQLTLEDLLFDLRSTEAARDDQGGLMLN